MAALIGDLILLPALLAWFGGKLKPETASFNGTQPPPGVIPINQGD